MVRHKFYLQTRSNSYIWYEPRDYKTDPFSTQGDTVSSLEQSIKAIADSQTLNWWHHYRIVTVDGEVVARFKTKPGVAKRVRGTG